MEWIRATDSERVQRDGKWREASLRYAECDVRIKVINAFEHNAPLDLLDAHRVALIHDAHGPGDRVMTLGATPTLRVGKSNSESFRIIRFGGGRVISCSYMGDATAPVPFPRGSRPPLRAAVDPPADGVSVEVVVSIINELGETFPNCRVALAMPAGDYTCHGGWIERSDTSDCARFSILSVRMDVKAVSRTVVRIARQRMA